MERRGGFRRLFRVQRRDAVSIETEFRQEIEAHLALAVDQLVQRGVARDEAVLRARNRFGDFDDAMGGLMKSARQRETSMQRRDSWDAVQQDWRLAARQLRRAPALTAAIAVTLAIGIGANLVMFGVVDRVLLSPPPGIVGAQQLRRIRVPQFDIVSGGSITNPVTNYATYADLAGVKGFAGMAAYSFPEDVSLGSGRDASQAAVTGASASFFTVLGVRPTLGRFYSELEDRPPSGAPVAVVSNAYWRRALGGDASVLGKTLPIGTDRFTVIGIAPPEFNGVELKPVDIWIPLTAQSYAFNSAYLTDRGSQWLQIIARLSPGMDPRRMAAEGGAAILRNDERIAKADPRAQLELTPIIDARGPGEHAEARVAMWLLGVAAVVLLVACANVATLLVTRALQRRQEIAVRLALGVSRMRLLEQLAAEAALLAAIAAVVAFVGAAATRGIVQRLLLPDVPLDTTPSWRVATVTAGSALVVMIVTTLAPAALAFRIDVAAALKGSGRTLTDSRLRVRGALLVTQVALSVMLLVGAGLFVRSLRNAEGTRIGLDTDRVLLAQIDFSRAAIGPVRQDQYWNDAVSRIGRLPHVASASLSIAAPMRFSIAGTFIIPGRDSVPTLRTGGPYRNGVDERFFATTGTRVLRGRAFTAADNQAAPRVILINETMAGLLWHGADPIGTCVRTYRSDTIPCATIVGVVENVHRRQLREDATYQYYMPYSQWRGAHATALLVRLDGPARGAAISAVRRTLQDASPDAPFPRVTSYADIVDPQLRSWKLGAWLFTVFGALAFVVAAVGLYGLLAYSVAQRRFEFGIRAALGASTAHIANLIFRRAFGLVFVGLTIGLIASAALSRRIAPLLLDVSPRDYAVYASTAAIVLLVTLAAAALPARRAASLDPMDAVRAN